MTETDRRSIDTIQQAMSAAEWEKAKGHLNAMVAIMGQTYGGGVWDEDEEPGLMKFQVARKRIDAFVKIIEDWELFQ